MSHSPKKPGMPEVSSCFSTHWSYDLLACTLDYIHSICFEGRPIGMTPGKLIIL